MGKDALGKKPRPVTGKREPDWSAPGLVEKVADASIRFKTIWIDHAPQEAIIGQLREYRLETLGRRGVPLNGRRLSQWTQAGKSACMWRLKHLLAQERADQGLPPNKYQVVIITINKRMTLKQFYQQILKELADAFVDERVIRRPRGSNDEFENKSLGALEQRVAEWVVRLEVDMIVADEAQRLDRESSDASDVTERIQVFLDRGVVPLVLVGNHKSREFFEKNGELAARLSRPMQLHPLDPETRADARLFKKFCQSFNEQLEASGIFSAPSALDTDEVLDALAAVSSGHVGRVARLIEEALPNAIRRGAASIEVFDLSTATREYAIGNGWVAHDPFSTPY